MKDDSGLHRRGIYEGPGGEALLIGARIHGNGADHLFDFARGLLIGPSGAPVALNAVFNAPRELDIRLRHLCNPEDKLRLLRRHANARLRVDPLFIED